MNRFLGSAMLLLAGVTVSACVKFDGACESDTDCSAGGVCDAELKHCVAGPDAGEAGDAGTDGGVACEPACAAHLECVGTACVARYTGVELLAPQTGSAAAGSMVEVRARLTLAGGRTANPPETLGVTVTPPVGSPSSGVLAQSGTEYAGTITLGSAEGAWTVQAQYEEAGLASGVATLTVDATAPVFTVIVPAAPARPAQGQTTYVDPDAAFAAAWKRDEVVNVYVTSTAADVDAATVTMKVQFAGAAELSIPVVVSTAAECGGAEWCGVAEVELWKPEMNAFRADLTVRAKGKDLAGNESAEATEVVKVTRWRWLHAAGGKIHSSPAIGPDGQVFFGTELTTTTGAVHALKADGTQVWPAQSSGAVLAGVALGDGQDGRRLYVSVREASGARLRSYDALSGTEGHACGPYGANSVLAAPMVFRQGAEAAAHVINNFGSGTLVAHRPTVAGLECQNLTGVGTLREQSALSGLSAQTLFGVTVGEIRSHTLVGDNWTTPSGWPVSVGLSAHSLAVRTTDAVGGGSTTGPGGVFAVPLTGGSPWKHTDAVIGDAWNPAVDASGRVLIGLDQPVLMSVPVGGTPDGSATLDGIARGTPVLGQGGIIYVATSAGTVEALIASSLAHLWVLEDLGDVLGSVAIDCSRDLQGTPRAGVNGALYVGTGDGELVAISVDSRGIDTTAQWPKWQRDPRNTGNADTALAQFACP